MTKRSCKLLLIVVLLAVVLSHPLSSQVGPPRSLTATGNNYNQVLLAWEPPSTPVSYYKVYRSVDSLSFEHVGNVGDGRTTYIDQGLIEHVRYYYYVSAVKDLEGGPISNVASAAASSPLYLVSVVSTPVTMGAVRQPYTYGVRATTADTTALLRYSLEDAPNGMSIDSVTGVINWTPGLGGSYVVEVVARNVRQGQTVQQLPAAVVQRFTIKIAEQSGAVRGRVLDDEGNGIPFARLRFYQFDRHEFTYDARTDAAGEYSVAPVETGQYYIYVKADDYKGRWYGGTDDFAGAMSVAVFDGATLRSDVQLARSAFREASVSGTVKDPLNVPIQNATVIFVEAQQFMSVAAGNYDALNAGELQVYYTRTTSTGTDGHYQVNLPAGKSYFAICKADPERHLVQTYYPGTLNPLDAAPISLVSDVENANMVLSPTAVTYNKIVGQIVDATTGTGVQAKVMVARHTGGHTQFRSASMGLLTVNTDLYGNYSISDVDSGTYVIQAIPYGSYNPGYFSSVGQDGILYWDTADSVHIDGVVSGINVQVSPAAADGLGAISGYVSSSDGSPLSGTVVYALSASTNVITGYGVTDSTGYYSISGLKSDTYIITADKIGYIVADRRVVALNYVSNLFVREVNLSLKPKPVVSVTPEPLPKTYELEQNYPNPFNPTTTIEYQITGSAFVDLNVYDMLGREVSALVSSHQTAGRYKVAFDATRLATGMYFYRLQVTNGKALVFSDIKKMVLMK